MLYVSFAFSMLLFCCVVALAVQRNRLRLIVFEQQRVVNDLVGQNTYLKKLNLKYSEHLISGNKKHETVQSQLHEAQSLNRMHVAEKQARLSQAERDANYMHVMPAKPAAHSDDIDAVERLLDAVEPLHGVF